MTAFRINDKPLPLCEDAELLKELTVLRGNPALDVAGGWLICSIESELILRERARTGDWSLSKVSEDTLHR